MMPIMRSTGLWIEWVILFIILPVVAAMDLFGGSYIVIFFTAVVYAWIVCKRGEREAYCTSLKMPLSPRFHSRDILRIFLIMLLLFLLALLCCPDHLWDFPTQHRSVWVAVCLIYPFLSVLPQEFFYRYFYFQRYRALFPGRRGLIISNAFAFAWAHLIYHNAIALTLTFSGGLLFAFRYERTRNFTAVWLEHTLYGIWIFTVGLGSYFYKGIF